MAERPVFQIDTRPKRIVLPETPDRTKINIRYPLIPPYAFARIFFDEENQELVYSVEEPQLSDTEKD